MDALWVDGDEVGHHLPGRRLEGRVENRTDVDEVVRIRIGGTPDSFLVTLPESALAAGVGAVEPAAPLPRSRDGSSADDTDHGALRIVFIS